MKAIFIERYGPPERLREREIASPEPAGDEVRLRVMASGVNFADILQRLNLYGKCPSLPYIPGFEVAGEVLEVGTDVKLIHPGARLVAMTRFGGYAEEVSVPARAARPIPDGLGFEAAAALPVNYLTAWFCLHTMGHLAKGERVLIQGGAGGVGTAAVQLARLAGAEIYATAGSREKVEFLKRMGVKHAINHRTQDFVHVIREGSSGRGLDLVLDAVGGETLRRGYQLLDPLGRLISYGLSAAAPSLGRNLLRSLLALWRTPTFKPLGLIGRNVGVFGFHLGLLHSREAEIGSAFESVLELVASGRVRPVISHIFPLSGEGAAAAHRFIQERRNIGKVLLVRS